VRGLASAAVILSLAACGSDDDDGGGPIDGGDGTVVDGGDTDGAGGDEPVTQVEMVTRVVTLGSMKQSMAISLEMQAALRRCR